MPDTAFGVIFHPTFPPESLAAYARRAEEIGFDELWLWDDCFLPGALTSAAIALSATQTLKVGIGLLPATAYNPLFAAMEITTLARAFPGRILPGFGHGVGPWMTQIGAAPRSSLKSLEETVQVVRPLLQGESVTFQGEQVRLDQVQMQLVARQVPPLYVGAMRQKSFRMAGRIGDGTILTSMSSPAYIRWAKEQVQSGMQETGRTENRIAVYFDVKIGSDPALARQQARQALSIRMPWADIQVEKEGIQEEVTAYLQKYSGADLAENIPDAWLDAFAASGSIDQATRILDSVIEAGANTLIFQPLNGDITCLDEYARVLSALAHHKP